MYVHSYTLFQGSKAVSGKSTAGKPPRDPEKPAIHHMRGKEDQSAWKSAVRLEAVHMLMRPRPRALTALWEAPPPGDDCSGGRTLPGSFQTARWIKQTCPSQELWTRKPTLEHYKPQQTSALP